MNPAAQQLVQGGAVGTRYRDYVGHLPGHPAGIPAGLTKWELNERLTEDFIQTIRTMHPPGRKSFKHRVSEKAGLRTLKISNCI